MGRRIIIDNQPSQYCPLNCINFPDSTKQDNSASKTSVESDNLVVHHFSNLDKHTEIDIKKDNAFVIDTRQKDKETIDNLTAKLDEANSKVKELENKPQKVKIVEKKIYVPQYIKKDDSENYAELLKSKDNIIEYYSTDPKLKRRLQPRLAEFGLNNTQIFTREIDIKTMIASIGWEKVINPETTILEPTAGDGAFTVRILKYRLINIVKKTTDLREFMLQSLQALSTIYAIEFEDVTCYTQRNNIYTTMHQMWKWFVKKTKQTKQEINKDWDDLVKKIIFDNIIWGAFAASNHPEYKNYDKVLGFDRASNRPLAIIKWSFIIDKRLRIKYRKEVIG